MKSNVYFVKAADQDIGSRLAALKKLLDAVNPFVSYKKDEFIPVKLTVGDSACIHNISPDFIKPIVSLIKKQGAKPFLFDTSVIYSGQRQNAVDHLNLIQSKGFGHTRVGAPFIIADGVFGQDGREFLTGSGNIDKIKVPSFIGMVDSLSVLSHVTGHIVSRYAGAIKNVAMGMSCRCTKQVQHSSFKPNIIRKKCSGCGCCVAMCPVKAISGEGGFAVIDSKLCVGCGECICACKFDAVYINWHEEPGIFCKRMADTARFILSKFRNKFFLNFAFDITKECDCISTKDEPMVSKNLGIFASGDIVSIDKATVDLAGKDNTSDFFRQKSNIYMDMLEYAAKQGLGNLEYNLVSL